MAGPGTAAVLLIQTLVPVGLRGFMFAVLIGAIMSTIDSLINSTSSLLTLDIYKGLIRKKATDVHLVRFAQLSGIGLLVFGALWSPMVGKFGSIFSYVQDCWALMLAPVMAVFVMALFWKRMTKPAAVITLFMAIPMLLIVFLREMTGMLASFNIFNMSAVLFLLSMGVIVLISRFTTPPSPPEIEATIWTPAMLRPTAEERAMGTPWWKRVGFWFSMVVLCFTVIYAVYW